MGTRREGPVMTLRHILVQADNSAPCGARVRTARAIAERFDATAVGLPCMTTALMQYPYSLVALGDTLSVLQDVDREAADRAQKIPYNRRGDGVYAPTTCVTGVFQRVSYD